MSDVRDFYETDASKYDEKRFEDESWQQGVHLQLLRDFLATVPDNGRVLELGCGTGRLTTTLLAEGFETTAVDISSAMLETARRRCRELDTETPVQFVTADAANLPFARDEFDACVMINVAGHLRSPEGPLQEIARVVRPNERVFANFPNLYSPYLPIGLLVNARGQSLQDDVYARWYSWKHVRSVLRAAQFDVERIRGHMFPPRNSHWVVDAGIRLLDSATRDSPLRYVSGVRFFHLTVDPDE